MDYYKGTLDYMAPEIFKKNCGLKIDIWSLGVILYFMVCREFPFTNKDDGSEEVVKNIEQGKYDFNYPEFENTTEECKELIRKCLEVDIDKRYSAEECLNDPFIKSID